MPKLRNGSKGDPNPGLDCTSGILPLSYRAPRPRQVSIHIVAIMKQYSTCEVALACPVLRVKHLIVLEPQGYGPLAACTSS